MVKPAVAKRRVTDAGTVIIRTRHHQGVEIAIGTVIGTVIGTAIGTAIVVMKKSDIVIETAIETVTVTVIVEEPAPARKARIGTVVLVGMIVGIQPRLTEAGSETIDAGKIVAEMETPLVIVVTERPTHPHRGVHHRLAPRLATVLPTD